MHHFILVKRKANWTKLSVGYFQKNRVQTQMCQNCGQFYYPVFDLLRRSFMKSFKHWIITWNPWCPGFFFCAKKLKEQNSVQLVLNLVTLPRHQTNPFNWIGHRETIVLLTVLTLRVHTGRHFRFSQIRQRSTVLLDIVGANSTRGRTFVVVSFCSWPVVGGGVGWQGHTVISSTPVKKTIEIWPCILIIVNDV